MTRYNSDKSVSGLLYVKSQPKTSLPPEMFQRRWREINDRAHRASGVVRMTQTWRAVDLKASGEGKEEWLHTFELKETWGASQAKLLGSEGTVWAGSSQQRAENVQFDIRAFDFAGERKIDNFREIGSTDVPPEQEGRVLVTVSISLLDASKEKEEAFNRWYEEEHIPLLSLVPGWLRTRRFVTNSSIERSLESSEKDGLKKGEREYLALHEYAGKNGLDGPEFVRATTTAWNDQIKRDVVKTKRRRVFEYVATHEIPKIKDIESLDSHVSAESPFEGTVRTRDGIALSYRISGSANPEAPLIILCNSILTNYHIWDPFMQHLFSRAPSSGYRILQYNSRGVTSQAGNNVTIDTLADDVIDLLNALEVKQAKAVIGVSLGGITALNTALRYPDRVANVIVCDTSAKSPTGNAEIWKERITVAEKENALSQSSQRDQLDTQIVGQQLAELTANRWFVRQSWDDAVVSERCRSIQEMIGKNSLPGFKTVVQALWDYDVTPQLADARVRALFIVGAQDGKLPDVMAEIAGLYEGGVRLEVIPLTGHLPMVEKPMVFGDLVGDFLDGC